MARAAEVALTGSDQLVEAKDLTRLMGWTVRNTHATLALTVDLYDGESAAGNRIGCIALAVNQAETIWLGEDGITVNSGIYADVGGAGGTVVGSIFIA
jgi:hypothetical protein